MYKVFLDAGHGGKDVGAFDPANKNTGDHLVTAESKAALSVTLYAKEALERTGKFEVKLSRKDDTFISLADRCYAANKFGAVIFAAIHFNAAKAQSARGIELWAYEKGGNGEKLAKNIYKYSTGLTPWADRGIKFNKEYAVLNGTHMPAVIFEGGFLTNSEEERLVNTKAYRKALGEAIARGIMESLGVKYEAPKVEVITNSAAEVQRLKNELSKATALVDKLNEENVTLVVEMTGLRAKVADLEKKYAELGPQIQTLTATNLEQSKQIVDLKNKAAAYYSALQAVRNTVGKV